MSLMEAQRARDHYIESLRKKLGREPSDSEINVEMMMAAIQAANSSAPDRSIPGNHASLIDNQVSLTKDADVEQKISDWLSPDNRTLFDWLQSFGFKLILFVFVLIGSAWWVWDVSQMVWQAGRSSSAYHLSDTVLVALITTSVANFLALVTIIANSLFPNPPKA